MHKRIALLFITTMFLVSPHLLGQQNPSPDGQAATGEDLAQRIEERSEELDLTDQQREQVRAILVESGERTQSVLGQHGFSRENPPQTRRDRRKLMRDLKPIRQWRQDELAKVLNPEQMKKLEDMQAQMREEFKARQ